MSGVQDCDGEVWTSASWTICASTVTLLFSSLTGAFTAALNEPPKLQ